MSTAIPASSESTFRAYSTAQGQTYAQARSGYPPKLYDTIVDYHTSHGGQLNTLLDVGCGPGVATREFAPRFAHAIGIDPSEGMIQTARACQHKDGEELQSIRYEVSSAEDMGAHLAHVPLADGSVDVITVAMAAHWFDMADFWSRAAQVLKPGGTVALWCRSAPGGALRVASSVPNHEAIQKVLTDMVGEFRPCLEPGNVLAANQYADLLLPWTLTTPVPAFDEASFVRQKWCTSSTDEYGPDYAVFPVLKTTLSLATLERIVETGSPVTRWREAHPEDAGTDRDVVRKAFNEIRRLMHARGVTEGQETLAGSVSGILLMMRKK